MPKFKSSNATFWVIFKHCTWMNISSFEFKNRKLHNSDWIETFRLKFNFSSCIWYNKMPRNASNETANWVSNSWTSRTLGQGVRCVFGSTWPSLPFDLHGYWHLTTWPSAESSSLGFICISTFNLVDGSYSYFGFHKRSSFSSKH